MLCPVPAERDELPAWLARLLDGINIDLETVAAVIVCVLIAAAAILPFWAMR